ncbi:hypothetical protein SARC_10151 [Sphaeroforma arctica JP610]|uniref:Uncharacterized protein n=1 Tax=Sphaeroforma arctica JP610 TaxID=667725 RepID=A0A0L0FKS1_9EUKA|nr:hypothetical protein SARC_10151 [Sphaeroforma arctica JP610]KNC77384.1 hypothetical protein SARC_10151 [Sphaeroforma arctica JP610]|eukprot:XP_014151286.1 hypothetical protein SARC_10151 [Sphaeroforma arctica JP610]
MSLSFWSWSRTCVQHGVFGLPGVVEEGVPLLLELPDDGFVSVGCGAQLGVFISMCGELLVAFRDSELSLSNAAALFDTSVPNQIASAKKSPSWASWKQDIETERQNSIRNEIADVMLLSSVPSTAKTIHTYTMANTAIVGVTFSLLCPDHHLNMFADARYSIKLNPAQHCHHISD